MQSIESQLSDGLAVSESVRQLSQHGANVHDLWVLLDCILRAYGDERISHLDAFRRRAVGSVNWLTLCFRRDTGLVDRLLPAVDPVEVACRQCLVHLVTGRPLEAVSSLLVESRTVWAGCCLGIVLGLTPTDSLSESESTWDVACFGSLIGVTRKPDAGYAQKSIAELASIAVSSDSFGLYERTILACLALDYSAMSAVLPTSELFSAWSKLWCQVYADQPMNLTRAHYERVNSKATPYERLALSLILSDGTENDLSSAVVELSKTNSLLDQTGLSKFLSSYWSSFMSDRAAGY